MAVFRPQVVWISGPYRGAEHDITIFREGGLKDKIAPGKKTIADKGYITHLEEEKMIAWPNNLDSDELARFKSRARLRLETFNGRLKFFAILRDTFRHCSHKTDKQHQLAFEAVCVTLQYQMENGSPVFAV